MIFWKCTECDEVNSYPEHKECQTCGERIEATQMEHIKFYQFYIDRANTGDMYAAVELFKLYTEGEHLEKNVDEGIRWLTLAAENNNGRAQYEMGKLYFFDKGIFERDDAKAYMWFKRSADNNYPYAGHYVAQCHIAGAGVPEDQKKGFELFLENANVGVPESQEKVAFCYMFGVGVEKNPQKAFYWYRRAADMDSISDRGALRLACYYYQGEVVERDDNEASKWFEQAYRGGNQVAGYYLAEIFLSIDNPTTQGAARNILKQVAESNDEEASNMAKELLRKI